MLSFSSLWERVVTNGNERSTQDLQVHTGTCKRDYREGIAELHNTYIRELLVKLSAYYSRNLDDAIFQHLGVHIVGRIRKRVHGVVSQHVHVAVTWSCSY